MYNKFSKFDIRSAKPRKVRTSFARLNLEFLEAEKKPVKSKPFAIQIGLFALTGIGIVLLLQAGLYFSNAKRASGEILGAATSAYSDLDNAGKNLGQQNLADAATLFESASNNVKLAQNKLNNYKALTWIAPQANSADHILTGAGFLASAGEKLTAALDLFGEFKVSSKGVETSDFESKLSANKQSLIETRVLVSKSEIEFEGVGSIPLDYENTLEKAKQQVSELGSVLDKLIGLENLYLNIFGTTTESQPVKTYLLIFQNYDEQRATGGFIGTYGVLKTSHGAVAGLKIDSIYNLDGRINELIAAPGPFQPRIARWGIRDANWFADFPTSAKKLLYLFEKGDETADGIISITPKVFEDLLRLTGPVEMPGYGVTLTAENFQEVVQYKTSVDYDHTINEPKKLLADFAPVLLDRLSNLAKEQWFGFFEIMQNNLNQRHILLYSKDPDAQNNIEDLGFSGKILPADYDYLSIVNSNLGGTKTDLEIEQKVQLKSKIMSDSSVINSVTITRKNSSLEKNRDYMRILVPEGSEFISSNGFDETPMYASVSRGLATDPDLAVWDQGTLHSNTFIRKEAGKTEFAGWLEVGAGDERSVTLTYMLPFKINQAFSLLLQKQAGSNSYIFEGSLSLGKYKAQWVSSAFSTAVNSVNFKSNSNTDDFWGFVLNK